MERPTLPSWQQPLVGLGRSVVLGTQYVGQCLTVLVNGLYFMFAGRVSWRTVFQSVAAFTVDSAPMIVLIAYIVGSVLALQVVDKFRQSGALEQVGGLVTLAIVREIGPIFTSLVVAAKNGTALASEVANMAVTDQLTALKVFQVSGTRLLLTPRLIVVLWSMPIVLLMFHLVSTLGGIQMSWWTAHLHLIQYLDSISDFLTVKDLVNSCLKSMAFGLVVVTVAFVEGVRANKGAKSVGEASTQAAVRASVLIMIINLVITLLTIE